MTEPVNNSNGPANAVKPTGVLVLALVSTALVLGIAAGVVLAGVSITVSGLAKTFADRLPTGATLVCTVTAPAAGDVDPAETWYEISASDLRCVVEGDPLPTG